MTHMQPIKKNLLYWLHMRHFKQSPVKAFHIPDK
jgi:hypothetical protein